MSVGPPGKLGAIKRITFTGYSCAITGNAAGSITIARTIPCAAFFEFNMLCSSIATIAA